MKHRQPSVAREQAALRSWEVFLARKRRAVALHAQRLERARSDVAMAEDALRARGGEVPS